MAKLTWLVVASLVTLALSDLYVSMPRCSNNRLNEQSANRNNGDRLFDSQNNNRGGYNCGDLNDAAFNGGSPVRGGYNAIPTVIYNAGDIDTASQYPMVYYEGSTLPIEWANQHGCGGNLANDPNKLNCQIVIQYMCETPHTNAAGLDHPGTGYNNDYAMNVHLRDGGNTNTPDEPNTIADVANGQTLQQNNANQRGRHESEAWYFECKTRSRNRRLFTADQNLNGNTAIYTRQNPNGNRRGLECPEERDYYPYWVPNPWRDIAYLTDRMDMAQMIIDNSMNTAGHYKYKCKQSGGGYSNTAVIQALTPTDCAAAGGVWTGFTHNMPDVAANRVVVQPMPWTRDNHLGNGRDGVPVGFNATLVMMDDLIASETGPDAAARVRFFDTAGAKDWVKCVLRVRYNMTTDDYDPWNTTSASNQNTGQGRQSPVTQNPTVDVGSQDLQGLALAINTNQFGRTFQDRSHTFFIKRRPAGALYAGKKIWNLNVRGKRGNIVQTYPAVEYDFMPNILTVSVALGDLIHMQWTGSNTHNNGDPGGDGQTGDAGEGTTGTDRHSWVQSGQSSSNYPLPLDKFRDISLLMDGHSTCYDLYGDPTSNNGAGESVPGLNCALILATSGQYQHVGQVTNGFNPTLNDAPASLIGGIVIAPQRLGSYNYIDTRNNNFSNRAQKGAIIVTA